MFHLNFGENNDLIKGKKQESYVIWNHKLNIIFKTQKKKKNKKQFSRYLFKRETYLKTPTALFPNVTLSLPSICVVV